MKRAFVGLLLAALLAGCNFTRVGTGPGGERVVGSGNVKTERRDVPEFERVEVSGAFNVEVECGKQTAVEVEADDNLLPLIKTEVEGGRLRVHMEGGTSTSKMPTVRLATHDLKEVSVPGAGDFTLKGVSNDELKIGISGAGRFQAAGVTEHLDIQISGAGSVDARELHARDATVVCNGAGSVNVHVTGTLDAAVNGVGSVNYYGDPQTVKQAVNGLGKITRR